MCLIIKKFFFLSKFRNELKVIASSNYLKGATWASFTYVQRTALFVTILIFVLQGNVATAQIVFMIGQFYISLQTSMAVLFPRGLHFYAEAKVSIQRLQHFLLLQEMNDRKVKRITPSREKMDKNTSLSIEKVNASWLENSMTNSLYDINVVVPSKSLLSIVGSVGSGKVHRKKIKSTNNDK